MSYFSFHKRQAFDKIFLQKRLLSLIDLQVLSQQTQAAMMSQHDWTEFLSPWHDASN